MPFETLKATRRSRTTSPAIRITPNSIYLNQYINTHVKARHVEIQVDKKTSQIRLVFKEKENSSTRRVTRLQSAAVVSFNGIMELLDLKQPRTIDVKLEGNQVTGTYKEKAKPKATLRVAK